MAGISSAADPNDLDAEFAKLQRMLRSVVEVQPGTCFQGLPSAYEGPDYLLVVVADSKTALESALAMAHAQAMFEAHVKRVCND